MARGPVVVRLSDCHPNDWNPNRMDGLTYAKTIESIKTFGFIDPLTVRPHPDGPGWQIIDGENRWKAASDVGLKEGPAFNLGEIDDAKAMQLTIILNELRGQYDPRSMGTLLKSLIDEEEVDELLRTLPFTEEALRGLVGMQDFDWGTLEEAQAAEPSVANSRWVERTFRLESEANAVLQQALDRAKQSSDTPMSDAQALEMIAADFLANG